MRQKTLLIADDEADLLVTLELHFARRGYETITAVDGKAALDRFGEAGPDVVLIDIQMPELDGITALRQMLEINPSARIFVMSGKADVDQVRMLLAEGARGFFPKPLNMEALGRVVDKTFFQVA